MDSLLLNNTLCWIEWIWLFPRTINGLRGIVTMHFLHADLEHLFPTASLSYFLGFGIFYFFQENLFHFYNERTYNRILTYIGSPGIHITPAA